MPESMTMIEKGKKLKKNPKAELTAGQRGRTVNNSQCMCCGQNDVCSWLSGIILQVKRAAKYYTSVFLTLLDYKVLPLLPQNLIAVPSPSPYTNLDNYTF